MNILNIYDKWEDKRNRQIISFLEYNPYAKIIDLGCGSGEFSIKIVEKTGSEEIYGIEVWNEFVKKSKDKGLKVIKSDLNGILPFKNESFDVVVSNQVIEHLSYPIKFVSEIKRILKSGGMSIVSTENLSSWDNIISLIFGWTPFSCEFDGFQKLGNPLSPHNNEKIDNYPPHMRIFTYKGLVDVCEKIGFRIIDIKGSGYIPFNFMSSIDCRHSRFLTIKMIKVG